MEQLPEGIVPDGASAGRPKEPKSAAGALKQQAKFALRDVYGEAAAVIMVRACVAIPIIGMAVTLLFRGRQTYDIAVLSGIIAVQLLALVMLSGAFSVGAAGYFFNVATLRDPQVIQIFAGFRCCRNAMAAHLLRIALTLAGSLLFVVPGVIAALRFAMTPYILAANPGAKVTQALRLSGEMMRGHGSAYLRLLLSFSGWFLLCLLTAGVGFLFIAPYIETAKAAFFAGLSEERSAVVEVAALPADRG